MTFFIFNGRRPYVTVRRRPLRGNLELFDRPFDQRADFRAFEITAPDHQVIRFIPLQVEARDVHQRATFEPGLADDRGQR